MASYGQGRRTMAQEIQALEGFNYSLMTVRCRDQEWPVHHFILRVHRYFKMILDELLRVGQGNLLVLDDKDDPAVVFRMLTWMYTSDYDDGPPAEAISGGSILENPGAMQPQLSRALNNIDVYCMAEKYEIKTLQSKASDRCLAQSWSLWTLDELTVLVKKLYPAAPGSCKELRKKLINACADQIPGFHIKADNTCAIADAGNFATDLSQEVQIRECEKRIEQLQNQEFMMKWDEFLLQRRLVEAEAQRDSALELLNHVARPFSDDKYERSRQCCDSCPLKRAACVLPRSYICRNCNAPP